MNKNELIQLHTLFLQMEIFLKYGSAKLPQDVLKEYSSKINPLYVHRSKNEHKKAIFEAAGRVIDRMNSAPDNSYKKLDPGFMSSEKYALSFVG